MPDWPTSYGWNMFTFPPSKWVGGILYEHGHRLIASTVGFLTIVLAVWIWMREPRRWVKWTAIAALATVIAQGILGGLTVLLFLPAAISTGHAGLAEIFFGLTISIALFTSPKWIGEQNASLPDRTLRMLATTTTALIYIQILVGATMRHTGAGLAIPDFPLMFGHVIPPRWDARIAVHFAHRVGALIVAASVLATWTSIWRSRSMRSAVGTPTMLLATLVVVQIALGALTVVTGRNVLINSLHVVCGALVFATSLVVTLRTWRAAFPEAITLPRVTRQTDSAVLPQPDDRRSLQPAGGARA